MTPKSKNPLAFIRLNLIKNPLTLLAITSLILLINIGLLNAQTVVGTITRQGLKAWNIAVYEKENKLIVSDWGSNHVLIYDGNTFSLLAEIDPGGLPGGLIVSQQTGNVFLNQANENRTAIINAQTLQLTGYLTGISGNMALDDVLGKLYIGEVLGTNLYVVDVTSKSVTRLTKQIQDLVRLNPVTHELFLNPRYGPVMEILDGNSLTLSTVTAMAAINIAVNWNNNKIYGCKLDWTGYWIYNRNNGDLKVTPLRTDASRLIYNPTSNRIHTNSEVNAMTVIIDGATDESFYLPMYPGILTMGVCYATNHVYYAGNDKIIILDDATEIIQQIPVSNTKIGNNDEGSIAINQTTNQVFISIDYMDNPVITVIQDTVRLTRPPVFLSPGGTGIYVTDPGSKQFVEHRLVKGFGLAIGSEIAASINGSELYFLESGMGGTSILSMFRGCGHFSKSASFETGGKNPISPVMMPDGRHVYITNSGSNDVSLVDLKTQTLVQSIPVGAAPYGAAITGDGKKLLVGNRDDNAVSLIQTANNAVTKTITVGVKPLRIAINPSGTKAYVVNSGDNSVSVIDLSTGNVATTISVGTTPRYAAITPDGNHVYVVNSASDEVFIIDAATDKVLRTINVGHSWGVCALPDGKDVYVGTDTIVVAINTRDFSVTPMRWINQQGYKVGSYCKSIVAVDPASRFAGHLKNSQGKAIAGAEVRAWQNSIIMGTATSNAAGDFCIFNLVPGIYNLELSIAGSPIQRLTGQQVEIGRIKIVDFSKATNIGYHKSTVKQFELHQNYPNPFNRSTIIGYSLPKESTVELKVYDLLGRELITLIDEKQTEGNHQVEFDNQKFSTGVYLYRLRAGEFVGVKKLVVIK
jgi:YVTN family beta-propeller protein